MVLDRKIAFIHLTNGSIEISPISSDLRKKFIGGRGINMYLLSKSYSPTLDPFSPENPLIFGAGLLTGTLGFGSRMNITAKSPESGHIGDSNETQERRKLIWDRIRAERCPFNALTVFSENAYHCDLCGENPQCIKVCTPKAISIQK